MSIAKTAWHKAHPRQGVDHPNFGTHRSQKTREKIRAARLRQVFPTKDTSIKRIVQRELRRRCISFKKHYVFHNWQIDIAFPMHKLLVECDGTYWHSLPKRKKRDADLDTFANKEGWVIIHLRDQGIMQNVVACVDRIESFLAASGVEYKATIIEEEEIEAKVSVSLQRPCAVCGAEFTSKPNTPLRKLCGSEECAKKDKQQYYLKNIDRIREYRLKNRSNSLERLEVIVPCL